jgi:hypothetical protein
MGYGAVRPAAGSAGRAFSCPRPASISSTVMTMTKRKPSGRGGSAERLMRDALIRELQDDGTDHDGGGPVPKSRLLARLIIDKALAGDPAAIKLIIDCVDGRVAAPAESAAPRKLTHEERLGLLE